ncbi:hypothetical protein GGF31_002817 [Allomyces arbusculus]|nr:hypothetical protein GGF31_002817 [Allomyces arbusculus]
MPRHSKNNTASAVFTYAERSRLSYGTQKQRLGKDSKRNFDDCFQCLQTAVDPMSCPEGHICCKECIYESILTQKKEIQAHAKLVAQARTKEEEKARAEQEQKALNQLAQAQAAISVTGNDADATVVESSAVAGAKRPDLPSFWIPSLAPSVEKDGPDVPEQMKKEVMCLSNTPHPLVSAKKLFPVKFTKDKTTKKSMCPSCKKQLTNGVKMSVLKTCGHVLCGTCAIQFVKSSGRCNVCDTKCRAKEIVPLPTEGTGFSSAGPVEAKRYDHAFQG